MYVGNVVGKKHKQQTERLEIIDKIEESVGLI